MSSFDDAFRRQAAENAARTSAEESERRQAADTAAALAAALAAAGIPIIEQMLSDFVRTLADNNGLQPKRQQIGAKGLGWR